MVRSIFFFAQWLIARRRTWLRILTWITRFGYWLFIEWLLGKEALALCGTSAAALPQAKGRGRCQIFPMTQETEDPRMTENRQ